MKPPTEPIAKEYDSRSIVMVRCKKCSEPVAPKIRFISTIGKYWDIALSRVMKGMSRRRYYDLTCNKCEKRIGRIDADKPVLFVSVHRSRIRLTYNSEGRREDDAPWAYDEDWDELAENQPT